MALQGLGTYSFQVQEQRESLPSCWWQSPPSALGFFMGGPRWRPRTPRSHHYFNSTSWSPRGLRNLFAPHFILQIKKLRLAEINLPKITLSGHQDSSTFNFKFHRSFQSPDGLNHT